ncbi:unnamed protein product [Microthlaspi erraticum]|uniref:non-specific serine/threonine protein kinase n=1 Tax=Microthlaspi erraticum TaxID=1685480 RepID=A0A6D2KDR5_9BRAS|nr:unnamed protein product [Microthlaspi erraticum]
MLTGLSQSRVEFRAREASDLYTRCIGWFICSDQSRLLDYPFWTAGREGCGHPDFKLECNANFPELNISSVKYRIMQPNYDSTDMIRLARSDYIGYLCPNDPSSAPFNEEVLPFAPNTELITIYHDCSRDFSQSVSTYVGNLTCENDSDEGRSYYVTRNISSALLNGIRDSLNDFGRFCRNVSIPASGPSLNRLLNDRTRDNLLMALAYGFELGVSQECLTCKNSGGVCGYNQTLPSTGFVCYCEDEQPLTRICINTKKDLSKGVQAGIGSATGSAIVILIAGLICTIIIGRRETQASQHTTTSKELPITSYSSKEPSSYPTSTTVSSSKKNYKVVCWGRKTSDDPRQQKLKALIPLKHYNYAQVKRMTKSFAEVVGRGGFGTVYRGTLCDGRSVAVKILKDSKGNNDEDFINEVSSMSKTSHVNIVDLLGFCSQGTKRAIIYEFLENGSLDRFISSNTSINMDWTTLHNIALGVARGLEYLHHGCKSRIVHFDIKPHNVLLDDNFCPKVSDFGLAKLCGKKGSLMSLLDTRGTIGYIAPEVFSRMYGRVSHKSDVYSYGMLILEMIGARKKERADQNSESNASSMYFPEWIYKDLEKRDNERLNGNGITCEEEEIEKKMTLVGLWCIQPSPSDRPSMNRVVEMMEGSVDVLEVPPRPVFQITPAPFEESSTLSEDISCGNITAGFPFSGENRPLACGYPSLRLHCYKNKTSIIISNHLYDVLDIDQTSNTLRLSRAELLGSFCNVTFTATTLPAEIFELSPNYKHLTVFYLCDPKLLYRSSHTCPGTGPVSVSESLDYENTCDASFRVYVPKSFVPEEKELNITNLESALSQGFEKIPHRFAARRSQYQDAINSTYLMMTKNVRFAWNLESGGVCGYNQTQTSSELVCHCTDEPNNRYFCGSYVPPNAANGRSKFGVGRSRFGVVAGSVGGGFMFLSLVLAIFLQIFSKRNRKESEELSQQNIKALNPQQDSKAQQNLKALNAQQDLKALIPLKQYSYATVKRITKSFAEVVGQGGFGTVYRGTLCDGRSVAVKILKNSKGTNGEDFINEVASMSLTSHVNIVTLLGFCSEGSKRAILYEFLENGSLDKFISSKKSSGMDWMALYKISLGVARGLEYLHHGCRTRIVHFDIKPHNVLLDDNLCPKVSDFGLAKLCKKKESILSLPGHKRNNRVHCTRSFFKNLQ